MGVTKAMSEKVARQLRWVPLLTDCTTDGGSNAEEEVLVSCKRCSAIKSGMVQTADSTVVKQITWPHELMYAAGGQPGIYEELILPLFVSGYLATILDTVKASQKDVMLKHQSALMVDAELYGQAPVLLTMPYGLKNCRMVRMIGRAWRSSSSSGRLWRSASRSSW